MTLLGAYLRNYVASTVILRKSSLYHLSLPQLSQPLESPKKNLNRQLYAQQTDISKALQPDNGEASHAPCQIWRGFSKQVAPGNFREEGDYIGLDTPPNKLQWGAFSLQDVLSVGKFSCKRTPA